LKYCPYTIVKISCSASPLFFWILIKMDIDQILSCYRAGPLSVAFLGGEDGTGGFELAAGVEASGGHPESSAMAERSPAVD
jgi:hypothetical protein